MRNDRHSSSEKFTYILHSDPFMPLSAPSHHSEIKTFIKELSKELNWNYLDAPQLNFASKNYGRLSFLRIVKEIVRQTEAVIKEQKILRMIGVHNVKYVNFNADIHWLFMALFFRSILNLNHSLRVRFIHTRDRRLSHRFSLDRLLFKLIKILIRSDDKLAAETQSYCSYLSKTLNTTFLLLPHPPCDLPPLKPKLNSSSNLVISFLGEARVDKGFLILPDLISEFANEFPEATYVVQAHVNQLTPEIAKTIGLLDKFQGVRLLRKPISDCEMREILGRTDLILAPYQPDTYRFRGSSIVQKAQYLGIVVFVEKGSGMSMEASAKSLMITRVIESHEALDLRSTIQTSFFVARQNEAKNLWRKFLSE